MFDRGKLKPNDITRADRILILCVLVFAVFLLCLFGLLGAGRRMAVVVVEQDGSEILRLSLKEDQTVVVPFEDGFNVIVVSGGSVFVSEADCPDQICVRQGEISGSGETIVCLPHRLVIRLEEAGEEGLDALTN